MSKITGTKNGDSIQYQEFFVKKKVCIPQKELWALEQAKEQYEFYRDKVSEGLFSPMEDNAADYLKIYKDLLKEIASRIYPKLKSIEQVKVSSIEGLTAKEKLEFIDQYRQKLIEEINSGSKPV